MSLWCSNYQTIKSHWTGTVIQSIGQSQPVPGRGRGKTMAHGKITGAGIYLTGL